MRHFPESTWASRLRTVTLSGSCSFVAMAAASIAHLAIFSKATLWWAGHCFGPRYCTDLLPFAALFLIPAA